MEAIPFKKINEEIIKQFDYLRSLDLSLGWRIHKFWIWFYSVATVGFLILYFTTDANTLIVLKVVSLNMLPLIYLFGLIAVIIDSVRRSRHSKKIKLLLDSALGTEVNYFIQFNEEGITFITDTIKSEVKWTYWEGYREVKGTLFLFLKDHLYQSTSFSAAEIGADNFESLIKIVKRTLPELEEYGLKKWYVIV